MIISVQPDRLELGNGHVQSYSDHWIQLARRGGYEVQIVDVRRAEVMEQLRRSDAFMWRSNVSARHWEIARRVLEVAETQLGMLVYPDRFTRMFHNDKIIQSYLLENAGIPIPRTWVFWTRDDALRFVADAEYPLVMKLAAGIQSRNVRLLRSRAEAESWVRNMFGAGAYALHPPNADSQTHSHPARSVARWARWLLHRKLPSIPTSSELQRHYFLIQQFLPGNEHDTRVTVIGNRAFGFRRFNRPSDFRASGSGRIDHDPSNIDLSFVRLAFQASRALECQTVTIDGLYGPDGAVTNEIDIAYQDLAVYNCPGHWFLDGEPSAGALEWRDGRMWPQTAIWEDFAVALRARGARNSAADV